MVRILDESTYTCTDIQKSGWNVIKSGDKVKLPKAGMTDEIFIGDNMRVGPLTGTCVDSTDDIVIMEVEFNAWATPDEVTEGFETDENGKKTYKGLTTPEEHMKFNDKYFPRVDLSDKSRYRYYKYKGKDFAYDTKDSVVIYLFRDDDEVELMGNKAPYREMDSVGLSPSNWRNKEARNEYLDEYLYDMDSYVSDLADDFVKNELPLYKESEEITEDEDIIDVDEEVVDEDPLDNLEISEYVISFQYTPDEDHSMTGEINLMATSEDEAEEEFYKYHDDDYYILEISRQENDIPETESAVPIDAVMNSEAREVEESTDTVEESEQVDEAAGNSADDIDPNQTGPVEPSGNDADVTMTEPVDSVEDDTGAGSVTSDDSDKDPRFKQDDDEEILVELDEDGSEFKEWTYTEDEIFDVAYELMNQGYLEGMEAADIQTELLFADHETIGDAPYIFTMIEEDDEEEVDDDEDDW